MNYLKLQIAIGAVQSACLQLEGNLDERRNHKGSVLGFHFDPSSDETRQDMTGPPEGNQNPGRSNSQKFALVQKQKLDNESDIWQNLNFFIRSTDDPDADAQYIIEDDYGYCLAVHFPAIWDRDEFSRYAMADIGTQCSYWSFFQHTDSTYTIKMSEKGETQGGRVNNYQGWSLSVHDSSDLELSFGPDRSLVIVGSDMSKQSIWKLVENEYCQQFQPILSGSQDNTEPKTPGQDNREENASQDNREENASIKNQMKFATYAAVVGLLANVDAIDFDGDGIDDTPEEEEYVEPGRGEEDWYEADEIQDSQMTYQDYAKTKTFTMIAAMNLNKTSDADGQDELGLFKAELYIDDQYKQELFSNDLSNSGESFVPGWRKNFGASLDFKKESENCYIKFTLEEVDAAANQTAAIDVSCADTPFNYAPLWVKGDWDTLNDDESGHGYYGFMFSIEDKYDMDDWATCQINRTCAIVVAGHGIWCSRRA